MKSKRKLTTRVNCGILAFILIMTSVMWDGISLKDIFGKERGVQENAEEIEEVQVSKEDAIFEENTKNSTTFDLGNGRKKIVFYSTDMRYKDENGKLLDCDPELVKISLRVSGGNSR